MKIEIPECEAEPQISLTQDDDLNKENAFLNSTFVFFTIMCYVGTAIMIFKHDKFWRELIIFMPSNYEIPQVSDLTFTLSSLSLIILAKIAFERLLSSTMYSWLSDKYKDQSNFEEYKLGLIYKKKLAASLFKVVYYTTIVIIGYSIMKDSDFFPKELGGSGDMINLFKNGVPGYLFFEKPAFFNHYYLSNLGFIITDLIWLLFIYETQNDFCLMLLHHSLAISLVTFSYLHNYSQIGIIVFFLHDLTDIFVYLVRIIINTNLADRVKVSICVFFLIFYVYMRLYVFGKLLLITVIHMNDWNPFSIILCGFMFILMLMHIYWIYQISCRVYHVKITDVGKIKMK